MDVPIHKFLALIRLGLGCAKEEDHSMAVSADEWPLLYKMAQRHGVMGVAFAGVQRLSEGKSETKGIHNDKSLPPKTLLLQWFGVAERIRKSNMMMDRQCAELKRMLESVGLDSCILKGQGVARLYPGKGIRQTGDIDVWVKTRVVNFGDSLNASFAEVRRRLTAVSGGKKAGEGKIGKTVYHHIEWHLPDAEVEVHIRPQQLNNPFANRAFQRWCNEQWRKMSIRNAAIDERNSANTTVTNLNAPGMHSNIPVTAFNTSSMEFNAVYLLAHMFHHLLFEGLAMKQVCDYAMLMRSEEADRIDKKEFEENLRSFGMLRFACGMMWVMREVFNIPREKMLVEPDEDEGRFVLSEIMEGRDCLDKAKSKANIKDKTKTKIKTNTNTNAKAQNKQTPESVAEKFWRRTRYRTRFLTRYPSEIFWDIPFRLYHYFWRMRYA